MRVAAPDQRPGETRTGRTCSGTGSTWPRTEDADELLDKPGFTWPGRARGEGRSGRPGRGGRQAHLPAPHGALLAEAERRLSRVAAAPSGSSAPQPTPATRLLRVRPAGAPRPGPRTARDVLDVGCGAGRLGPALKARQGAGSSGSSSTPGPPPPPATGSTGSSKETSKCWSRTGAGGVRRGRLRRRTRTSPRPGRRPPPRPRLAPARRAAGRQHPERPAPLGRPGPLARRLDVRAGRPARPDAPAVLHPPRDREAPLPLPGSASSTCPSCPEAGTPHGWPPADQGTYRTRRPAGRRPGPGRGRGVLRLPVPRRGRARTAADYGLTSIVIVTHNQVGVHPPVPGERPPPHRRAVRTRRRRQRLDGRHAGLPPRPGRGAGDRQRRRTAASRPRRTRASRRPTGGKSSCSTTTQS